MKDNRVLLDVFQQLVDKGNSVIIIEHDFNFIAESDWIIEMGPEGGEAGGYVIFEGSPLDMLGTNTSSSKWFKKALEDINI